MLAHREAHELQMFAWMVSKPPALLWAGAEVRDLGAEWISALPLPSKTRASQ